MRLVGAEASFQTSDTDDFQLLTTPLAPTRSATSLQGAPATSAIVRPDGTVLTYQPYGKTGLLVADLDLELATGLLAKRLLTY